MLEAASFAVCIFVSIEILFHKFLSKKIIRISEIDTFLGLIISGYIKGKGEDEGKRNKWRRVREIQTRVSLEDICQEQEGSVF